MVERAIVDPQQNVAFPQDESDRNIFPKIHNNVQDVDNTAQSNLDNL